MTSIFGVNPPQFIYDRGGANEVTVPLPYVNNDIRSEPATELVSSESDIDGQRESYLRGSHWVVEMTYNLHKELDAAHKYGVLSSWKGYAVTLYLHDDGDPFFQAGDHDADALFILKEVIPSYITTTGFADVVTLRFESESPVFVGDE